MNAIKVWFVATTVLCLTGFLVTASPALAGKGVETRLFFGASISVDKQPCGGVFLSVTDEAWNLFVAKYIGKAYDGFTVVEAIGHCRATRIYVCNLMTKRGNNEGSIYKRTDGRWAAAISLPGRKRRTLYLRLARK